MEKEKRLKKENERGWDEDSKKFGHTHTQHVAPFYGLLFLNGVCPNIFPIFPNSKREIRSTSLLFFRFFKKGA